MRVLIAGGGKIGASIAVQMVDTGAEITVVEPDSAKVRRGREITDVNWVQADATDIASLEDAGAREADVVVAAIAVDDANLVVSLLAKMEFGVPRVIARINDPENEWLFNESWGVDAAVSHASLIAAFVKESVAAGALVRLLTLGHGQVRILEVRLAPNSPAIGQSLESLDLPRDATLIAVIRDQHLVHPKAETEFAVDDEIMALAAPEVERDVQRIFLDADGA